MPTVIFDFDSTIITCESLELILQDKLSGRPDLRERIHQITDAGLRGTLPFADSLAQRLAIAAPSRSEAEAFGVKALEMITPGMQALIGKLRSQGVDLWIVSGGLYESLLPVGRELKFPDNRILGVRLLWDKNGEFLGINPDDLFSRSKAEGSAPFASDWPRPRIAVGDAMSDYRLFKEKLTDHFILFEQHAACREVASLGVERAQNVDELEEKIYAFIGQRQD
jgi:phosphoserine phosphatase